MGKKKKNYINGVCVESVKFVVIMSGGGKEKRKGEAC